MVCTIITLAESIFFSQTADEYGKSSKMLDTFLFLFSNKMLVFRAAIHKCLSE